MVIYYSPGAPAWTPEGGNPEGLERERAIQIAALAGGAGCGLAGFENCCCSQGTSGRVVRKLHHRHAAGRSLAGGTMGKLPHASVNLNCRGECGREYRPIQGSERALASTPRATRQPHPTRINQRKSRQVFAGNRQIYAD
jgi:hypothetical protein